MKKYFDYNATTPMRGAAISAMGEVYASRGNPSSVHGFGRAAKSKMDAARTSLARNVGCSANDLVFTSGGTESNNLVIYNAVHRWNCTAILLAATEHPSLTLAANASGLPVHTLPVLPNGLLDMPALKQVLAKQEAPFLVGVMLANNETGVIQPIAEIAELVHASGGLLHVDAAQAFGKIAVSFGALGADILSIAAHKIGGPCGIGALAIDCQLGFGAQMLGGGQESGRRAGTSNVAGMVGFAAAASEAVAELDAFAKLAEKRDHLAALLRTHAPNLVVFGADVERLPNTFSCAALGFPAATQIMAMDLDGFAISAGSACSSGKAKSSKVLHEMGVDEALAACAVRISMGWLTCDTEIEEFAASWGAGFVRAAAQGDV